jgi:superfamily II DNA helicase RecQ
VAHLVFDEAHISMIVKDYRKSLEHIYQVHSMPMQLVLLSAILPPTFIPDLIDSYNLLPNTTVICQSANTPELVYVLEKVSYMALLTRTVRILSEETLSWSKENRGLVFISSIANGQKLADLTKHVFYVGNRTKMSDEARWNAYNKWIQGSERVMITMTNFSTGNDYPHVQLVVQMDKPFNMLEFSQGQGRAGRDGQVARCYLLAPQSTARPSVKQSGVMAESKLAIYDHVFTYGLKRCLQYGMTSFKDSIGLACRQSPDNQL